MAEKFDSRVSMRSLSNQMDEVMDRIMKTDPRKQGGMYGNVASPIAGNKDFKLLDQHIRETNDILTADTEILKDDAETNKLANKLQIAKEFADLGIRGKQTKFFDKQIRHNAGARTSRKKMENQNDMIMAQNEVLLEQLAKALAGGGTSGETLPAGPTGGDPDPSLSDPDQQRINEIVDRVDAKQFTPTPDEMRDAGYSQWESTSRLHIDLEAHKRRDAAEAEKLAEKEEAADKKATVAETEVHKVRLTQAESKLKKLREGDTDKPFHKPREKAIKSQEAQITSAVLFPDENVGPPISGISPEIAGLAGDIRAGMGYAGGTRNRGRSMASKGSAAMQKNLGKNLDAVQSGMQELDRMDSVAAAKAQQELTDLTKMMTAKAAGEKYKGESISAEDLRVKTKRVQGVMGAQGPAGEKLVKDLGLSEVHDALSSERGFGTMLKNYGGVDSDKSGMDAYKQSWTAERLFGVDEDGPSKLASIASFASRGIKKGMQFGVDKLGETEAGQKTKAWIDDKEIKGRELINVGASKLKSLGNVASGKLFDLTKGRLGEIEAVGSFDPDKKLVAETGDTLSKAGEIIDDLDTRTIEDRMSDEQAKQELAVEDQTAGVEGSTGEEGLDILQRDVDLSGEIAKSSDETAEATTTLAEEGTDGDSLSVHDSHVEGKLETLILLTELLIKKDTRTGQDTETTGEKQLETLEDIRDALEGTVAGQNLTDGSSGPGLMTAGAAGLGLKKYGGKIKGLAKGGLSKLGGAAKGAAKFAKFIPGVGLAVAGATALAGGFMGARKAGETFGLEEGEEATAGQKTAAGVAGALSALTFGLADSEKMAKGIHKTFSGKSAEDTLAEVQEKDPELAAKIEGMVASGMTLEEAIADNEDQIKDVGVDTRSTAEKVLDRTQPLGWAKQGAEGLMDWMTTTEEEATAKKAMETAKESGLYEKVGMFGQSSIDKSKLEAASVNELKAILADDDLNNEDRVAVEQTLEKKRADVAAGIEQAEAPLLEVETPQGTADGNLGPNKMGGSLYQQGHRIEKLKTERAAITAIAEEMGIDPSKVEGTIQQGKVTSINGQEVPEELQEKSMDLLGSRPNIFKGDINDPDLDGVFGDDLGTMSSTTLPTGDAIDNMTVAAGEGGPTTDSAPIIVNNTTPAPTPQPSEDPSIAIMPARVRTASSVLQRYQDKRFRI